MHVISTNKHTHRGCWSGSHYCLCARRGPCSHKVIARIQRLSREKKKKTFHCVTPHTSESTGAAGGAAIENAPLDTLRFSVESGGMCVCVCVCVCVLLVVFGCKGTRASVASSVRSLSLIQLAAIWWIPFQRGGGAAPQLAFTAAGGRTHTHTHTHTHITTPITAMIVIHPNRFLLFFFFVSPSSLLSLGVHRALLLYVSLVTIVCVCVCVCVCVVCRQEKSALPCSCSQCMLVITHTAHHIAGDVNSWGDKFIARAELWGERKNVSGHLLK